MNADILWTPSMPPALIASLAVVGLILLTVQFFRAGPRGVFWRGLLLGALVVALMEPRVSVEDRTPENDIAVVVVDETTSQKIGDRRKRSEEAAAALVRELETTPGMEVRTVTVRDGDGRGKREGSRVVGSLIDAGGQWA